MSKKAYLGDTNNIAIVSITLQNNVSKNIAYMQTSQHNI